MEQSIGLCNSEERQYIPVGIGVHSGIAYFGAMGTAEGLTDLSAKGEEVIRRSLWEKLF